jgi:hypothetical protein
MRMEGWGYRPQKSMGREIEKWWGMIKRNIVELIGGICGEEISRRASCIVPGMDKTLLYQPKRDGSS